MIKTANLTGSISRNSGGLYESVRRLVQSLTQEGVGVRVFGAMDEFAAADIAAWSPVQVMAFKPSWPEALGFSPEFLSELLAYRPDLTHTHGIWRYTSIAANNYCRAMGTPYMISPHGMLDPWAVRNSRWKKMVAHALYEGAHLRGATCLRALCESEARAFRLAGLTNPICIIPNGIDLPPEAASKERRARSKGENAETLKLESGNLPFALRPSPFSSRKVLLYLGRIHPKKGLINLIKAWKQTLNPQLSTNNWLLAIAGWDQGGHEAELKNLCNELGLAWQDVRKHSTSNQRAEGSGERAEGGMDKAEIGKQKTEMPNKESSMLHASCSVLFLGPQFGEYKAACYANCDAFILPSFSEGLPMVVLEAWAYGKPVLMTPECNLPEGFAAGAALRMEPSAKGIEQGLRELFQMPDAKLQALGDNGRQLAVTRFSWSFIAKELKQVYEWMLGGGPKPASLYPD